MLLCSLLIMAGSVVRPDRAEAGDAPQIAWEGNNPYIFAVGDSVLAQCGQQFGMGWRSLGFIGWGGATASDMRGRLDGTGSGWPADSVTESSVQEERLWFRDAGSLVIALGINDVKFVTVAEWRDNVDWFMTQARGRPVQWFTIHNPPFQANVDLFNAELRLATDRWPNLKLMDWERYASAHPEVTISDRVHLAYYREGCELARNRLIQHAAPAVPGKTSPTGFWYVDSRTTGRVALNGWGAAYAPTPAHGVQVNVRVDWRHFARLPVDRPTGDIWANAASAQAFGHSLGAEYRGHAVCLDLVDQRGQFAHLGCRIV
ncbi:hypothetical protein [Blastococcus haudaquaticus]|uniref:SGNH hydrolase-type esterase domain-containing protein n=1 Tax=Blastococcus haudaquaticus TaxID=1938745 RepID=A0A286GFM4_9ACTN|nr:hypothetical protein [Blastococcus haudaquaticus]SOD93814.1 hypothetical protein SAMN06272739_0440 [Blastococcus haudaquaticus]